MNNKTLPLLLIAISGVGLFLLSKKAKAVTQPQQIYVQRTATVQNNQSEISAPQITTPDTSNIFTNLLDWLTGNDNKPAQQADNSAYYIYPNTAGNQNSLPNINVDDSYYIFSNEAVTQPYTPAGPVVSTGTYTPYISTPQVTPVKQTVYAGWQIPAAGQPYAAWLTDAESKYGLPAGLLGRVAYQESRFRPEIINGTLQSTAGAIGIMQIVPQYHPTVNPYDPQASIYYAASYLRQLYNQFGNWLYAVAAYNWGPANLSKYGLQNAPVETRNYVSQIGADIPLGQIPVWA